VPGDGLRAGLLAGQGDERVGLVRRNEVRGLGHQFHVLPEARLSAGVQRRVLTGPGSWGNQYSVSGKQANEFSSLQLIVPDAKDAADGTDDFLMTVGFGELFKEGYSEHVIDSQKKSSTKKGSGTITVDDRKTGGKVTFKGKAEDGTGLEGTIVCHQLLRAE
jgi:hypothetical protein